LQTEKTACAAGRLPHGSVGVFSRKTLSLHSCRKFAGVAPIGNPHPDKPSEKSA